MSEFFSLGAKCRVGDGEEIFDDLEDYVEARLEEYVDLVVERTNVPRTALQPFLIAALAAVNVALAKAPPEYTARRFPIPENLVRDAKATLSELRDTIVVTMCDKHADMYCIVCRRLYNETGWAYIKSQSLTYKAASEPEAQIVTRLADEAERLRDVSWWCPPQDGDDGPRLPTHRNPECPTRLSHLHMLFKFHKPAPKPKAPRPICANPETPEFPVARRVNAALGFILAHSADRLWRDLGIHRFGFVLPSSSVLVGCEAVGERVRLINQLISRGEIDVHKLRFAVFDFTSMYTKFHEKTHTVLNLEGLIERLDFVVRNSYVFWGGEVFHQQIGVAMGLIPAGLIATVVCFTYEIEFLSRCLDRLDAVTRADPRSPEIPKLRAKVQFALLVTLHRRRVPHSRRHRRVRLRLLPLRRAHRVRRIPGRHGLGRHLPARRGRPRRDPDPEPLRAGGRLSALTRRELLRLAHMDRHRPR